MAINFATRSFTSSGGVFTFGPSLTFSASGIPQVTNVPGYSASKSAANTLQYTPNGVAWPLDNVAWNSGALVPSTGVFTCPLTGVYAMGFGGIANGGADGFYGYGGFARNYVMLAYTHWNVQTSTNGWQQVSGNFAAACSAGDTLTFHVNGSPAPYIAGAQTNNRGFFPNNHHHMWVIRIG